ncbi:MAG: phycobiliprotein lyase [Calothrix sp. MO_192.B10]|nr:phycobiliprotein lyase [Calothrix sp. MO_192.B10]
MKYDLPQVNLSVENLIAEFFRQSEGNWQSQRRYYTLKSGDVEEVTSTLSIRLLEQGSPELVELAQLHEFADHTGLICGVYTTWESNYSSSQRKQLSGSTVFGVKGNILYRDRGFATSKPVTAKYSLPDNKTMHLRTEYGGSVFEEEIKLIGSHHRTRQTIISRASEEIMIGQYLEKRWK